MQVTDNVMLLGSSSRFLTFLTSFRHFLLGTTSPTLFALFLPPKQGSQTAMNPSLTLTKRYSTT